MLAISSQCQGPAVSGNVNVFLVLKQSQHCALLFQISQGDARKKAVSDGFTGKDILKEMCFMLIKNYLSTKADYALLNVMCIY